MHDIKDFLNTYNIKPLSYRKDKNRYIVSDKNNTYIVSNNRIDKEIYNILKARNYNFFPDIINSLNDKYLINRSYLEYSLPDSEKAKDIISMMSTLHLKTTHYENIDPSFYKEIYKDIALKIDDMDNYFNNLTRLIFEDIYMSPSMYLFIRNSSKLYSLIEFLTNQLDDLYTLVAEKEKKRVSVINNNLSLNNYIKSERTYIINWDKAKLDLPIKDLEVFYKNTYDLVDFEEMLEIYTSKYPLLEEELKLFFISISIPDKLEFTNDEYKNVLEVEKFYDYINKTDKLISKYYSQNKNEKY